MQWRNLGGVNASSEGRVNRALSKCCPRKRHGHSFKTLILLSVGEDRVKNENGQGVQVDSWFGYYRATADIYTVSRQFGKTPLASYEVNIIG